MAGLRLHIHHIAFKLLLKSNYYKPVITEVILINPK